MVLCGERVALFTRLQEFCQGAGIPCVSPGDVSGSYVSVEVVVRQLTFDVWAFRSKSFNRVNVWCNDRCVRYQISVRELLGIDVKDAVP